MGGASGRKDASSQILDALDDESPPGHIETMTTHRAIVDALTSSAAAGNSVVLATVVRVTGSSYGGVGTRMVVRVDGSTVGIVSGGCLETDLAEHARKVHSSGEAQVVTYDTRADDDAAWGLGLGCNGLIDVLLEPMTPVHAGAFAVLLEQALNGPAPSVLATIMRSQSASQGVVGAHALFDGGAIETTGDWGNREALTGATADADEALREGRRGLVKDYGGVTVAFEVVHPAVRLVVCGSGPDVIPLVRFGTELGWHITVVDHRPVVHAHAERFPGAKVVECADPLRLADSVALTPHSAAVVMSHHYARDLDYVRALLKSQVAYIGVLGPRARSERMLAEMESAGDAIEGVERMFAPVGIDIGGDGPDAIALSVIAEVSAVTSSRGGGHLRDRRGPLHAAVGEERRH
jgi:xanthine/CO dehydrogenase XdhC/CoxF family maturation factor